MPITKDTIYAATEALSIRERTSAAIEGLAASGATDVGTVEIRVLPPVVLGPSGSVSQPTVEFTLKEALVTSFLAWLETAKMSTETELTRLDVDFSEASEVR